MDKNDVSSWAVNCFLGQRRLRDLPLLHHSPTGTALPRLQKSLAAQLQEERHLQDLEYNTIEALNQEDKKRYSSSKV
jgi:hypothetical protein